MIIAERFTYDWHRRVVELNQQGPPTVTKTVAALTDPPIASGSPIVIIEWIAQTFLQLMLLPVVIVG